MITHIETLRASAEQLQGTVTGDALKLQYDAEQLNVILDVTAAATAVNDTLNVYIDTSFDGGITWVNIGHFTQVLGNGGVKRFLMSFKANPLATSNVVDHGANQTAGNALQVGFGDRIRYRGVVVEGGSAAFTYAVKAFLK